MSLSQLIATSSNHWDGMGWDGTQQDTHSFMKTEGHPPHDQFMEEEAGRRCSKFLVRTLTTDCVCNMMAGKRQGNNKPEKPELWTCSLEAAINIISRRALIPSISNASPSTMGNSHTPTWTTLAVTPL